MTMHKALHSKDDKERLYRPRKEGGRGLAIIEDSVDTTTSRLYKKEQRKTKCCNQKQHKQHNDQEKNND